MTKTMKMILAILIAVIILLVAYSVAIQDKVKAWNDLLKTQERIEELNALIEDAQFRYAIAETAKNECIESWNNEKVKLHNDAEKYRIEKSELEGFLLNR